MACSLAEAVKPLTWSRSDPGTALLVMYVEKGSVSLLSLIKYCRNLIQKP